MESSQDIEVINLAIQKLIEENRIKDDTSFSQHNKKLSDDQHRLLSRLLSQLETLKGGSSMMEQQSETCSCPSVDKEELEGKKKMSEEVENGVQEEIVKELKAVKRQNTITHCLLSVLIVVTVVFQLSEVSVFLKVRDGLSHPFRSFGSMLVGLLPTPPVPGKNGINMQHLDNDQNPLSLQNNHTQPGLSTFGVKQ